MKDKEDLKERIRERVMWWITDMAFKPPEITTESYYQEMADNIASVVDEDKE